MLYFWLAFNISESNNLPVSGSSGPLPLVAVCRVESLFVHMTNALLATFAVFGSKLGLPCIDAPLRIVIETLLVNFDSSTADPADCLLLLLFLLYLRTDLMIPLVL